MTAITQLSAADALDYGDQLPAYILQDGDVRKVTLSLLLSWIEANSTFSKLKTQYAAPTGVDRDVTVTVPNSHVLITPTVDLFTSTLTLPASPADKDEVLVTTTRVITTLTISSAKTVTGAPTTVAANGFFRLKYDGVLSTWVRIG